VFFPPSLAPSLLPVLCKMMRDGCDPGALAVFALGWRPPNPPLTYELLAQFGKLFQKE